MLALTCVVLLCGATLAACARGAKGAADGRLLVVAGFYPLAEAAARVGGDSVQVTNLTPAGAEPHDLELRPDDADRIDAADVVLYLGGGFQPAVEKAAKRSHRALAVDLLDPADRNDPHVWLDPTAQAAIAERVAAVLVRKRPAAAASFSTNAERYSEELASVDVEFRQGLSDCDRHTLVTSHAAWGHLASRYGLEQRAITGLSPESEVDPRHLAELTDDVKRRGVTTIFTERLVSPRVAEALAREAGVATAVLDPLEGLTKDESATGATYASVMRANLQRLRTGLGCR